MKYNEQKNRTKNVANELAELRKEHRRLKELKEQKGDRTHKGDRKRGFQVQCTHVYENVNIYKSQKLVKHHFNILLQITWKPVGESLCQRGIMEVNVDRKSTQANIGTI